MAKNHGNQIKDDKLYEELREQGQSKEKAARIANASSNSSRSAVGKKGGHGQKYEDRTKDELLDKAAEVGISGRSKMNKDELIRSLRQH